MDSGNGGTPAMLSHSPLGVPATMWHRLGRNRRDKHEQNAKRGFHDGKLLYLTSPSTRPLAAALRIDSRREFRQTKDIPAALVEKCHP
jgi:hypothetical protein